MTEEATDDKKRSGQPWRKIRMDDTTWAKFGDLVGERDRSEVVRSLIHWLLDHGTADLAAVPQEQVLDFFVRVRVRPDDDGAPTYGADVISIPGSKGPGTEEARRRISAGIADSMKRDQLSEPAKRARKAAK